MSSQATASQKSHSAASTPSVAVKQRAAVVVNERGAARWRSGHPWIYRSDVVEPAPEPINSDRLGDFVEPLGTGVAEPAAWPAAPVPVRDRRGRWLGVADYSPQSQIALRWLGRDAQLAEGEGWLKERIERAGHYRRAVVRDSDCYRLVWGEADGLPGLVVDRYAEALVVQTLTAAMDRRQARVIELLEDLFHPAAIVERNDARVRRLEGLETRSGLLKGAAGVVEGQIGGLRFEFDLPHGQKTGGFLDQRENWQAAADYAARLGCTGEALDAFTYQGAFASFLARCCRRVEAADISRDALERAERNAALNGLANIEWIESNAFDLLRNYEARQRRFDVVVLDPPAFAKRREALAGAERGYKEINLRALKLLRRGGLLISCSCSHHVSEAQLLEIIAQAALDAWREVVIIERRTQALDHPVLLTMPESYYLKCIVARVR